MARELLLTGAYQYTEDQLARLKKTGWNIEFLQNEMERTNIPVDGFEAVVCNNLLS